MHCPHCGFDNPVGTKFCGQCGTKLGNPCPSCGASNPEGFTYCGTCGTRLAAATPAVLSAEERKIVTVLFADLTGSTSLGERLDPEQTRAIMRQFFEAMAEVIARYGGTVEKFIGDEVMAVFGLPAAHEDDPERALLAAVAMHDRLQELNAQLQASLGVTLQMRIGINTGEVVANPHAAEKGEFMVTGDAVNVAARLRSAARPDATLVGERTYRHSSRVADYQMSPPLTLKGKAEHVPAWELIGLRPEPAHRAPSSIRAPLIGRDHERGLLQTMLQRVLRERKPHLVTILGLPGVGKSRLLEELMASAPPEVTLLQGRSLPYGNTFPLWAVAEIIRSDCGILRSDPPAQTLQKLEQRLRDLFDPGVAAGELRQVLAQLSRVLAIRLPEVAAVADDSRDGLFWALRRYMETRARRSSLVLTFEDLHWGDAELLDLIEHLAQWTTGAPLFIACLARPELLEVRPTWGGGKRNYTAVFLDPLTSEDTLQLIQELLHTEAPPRALVDAIHVAGGNPFFIEEILHMFIDSGVLQRTDGSWEITGALTLTVPETIQGVIAARLDRLGREEKSLLQEASVLGKEFWMSALAHVAGAREDALAPVLQTLQAKDFLAERERSRLEGQREFTFKQLVFRDMAYATLPKGRRAEKHRAYGIWLEQTLADRSEEFSELLAYHWVQAAALAREVGVQQLWAEAARKALRFALLTGRKAARLYANEQAIAHFQTARSLAEAVGADAERISAIEGLADVHALQAQWEEASRLYHEALEYHAREGDALQQARVQSRIGSTFSGVFDFRQALPHIRAAMETLQSQQEGVELTGVYIQMARTQTAMGHFKEAEEYARKGLQLAEQGAQQAQIAEGEWALGFISTLLGRSDAVPHYERCIEIAKRVGDLGWVIQGLAWKAFWHRWRAEYVQTFDAYAQALAIAEETNNRPRMAFCHTGTGETHFLTGNWTAAAASWRQYLTMTAEVPAWAEHARAMLAFMQGNLAEAIGWAERFISHAEQRREVTSIVLAVDRCASLYLHAGRHADALRLLTEALERFTPTGVIWPAFYRPLAAEAALALGDFEKASTHCDEADAYRPLDLKRALARLHRSRGLIYNARGQWEEAVNHITQAVATYQEIGQPYDRALCMESLADVHLRRGSGGDRERAAELRVEAMQIYQQLGAEFEVRRLQESHFQQ